MMIHRSMTLAVLAAASVSVGAAFAQAPILAPVPSEAEPCRSEYALLRKNAAEKGKLVIAASERHAPPRETCRLIAKYSAAEAKVIQRLETHASECRVPEWVADQLKADHAKTEAARVKVCANRRAETRSFPRPDQ